MKKSIFKSLPLKRGGVGGGLLLLPLFLLSFCLSLGAQSTIKVGGCDWMMLKRQKLGEFKLAAEVGADGVEMDMGGLGKRDSFDNKMREPESVITFQNEAKKYNIEVGAIAMSGFYGQSFAEKKSYKWLITDCLNTMDAFNVRVAFLPLGGCGNDWPTNQKLRKEIVKRLRTVGNLAAKRGKTIGIDTPLSAEENLQLLKEINSKGISIFYKFQTAIEHGRDIPAEIKLLGRENICAFHASNTDGVWIELDPAINMPAIKKALDEIQWEGWMFVERSRDVTQVKNVKKNWSANVKYLKAIASGKPASMAALKSEGLDSAYVQTILGRAMKAVNELQLTDETQIRNVRNVIANRYFELNKIYADRDTLKKQGKKELAQAQCDSQLYRSHFNFDCNLSTYLTPEQIVTVKDVMTFNSVKVQFDAYCDMIPTLTEEEKAQIYAWFVEARELAIDCESSNKKHEMFKKYKGRVNNYLTKRGYDMNREREEWYKRVEARGEKL